MKRDDVVPVRKAKNPIPAASNGEFKFNEGKPEVLARNPSMLGVEC